MLCYLEEPRSPVMPTPVRVRGKKGNKQRVRKHKTAKEAAGKAPASKEPHQQQLSRLERLPNELLQDIFLLSMNFDLPLVSRSLNTRLSSDRIKRELVISAFSDGRFIPRSFECTEDNIDDYYNGSSPDWFRRTLKEGDYLEQTSLACRRWFNLEFLQQCQRDYFLRETKKAILQYKKHCSAEVQNRALKAFEDWLLDTGSLATRYKFRVSHDGEPQVFYLLSTRDIHGNCYEMRCYFTDPGSSEDLEGDAQDGMVSQILLDEPDLEIPVILDGFVLPNKVLRGPWDHSKLCFLNQFLETISNQGHEVDYDRSVADSGLSDAIQQYYAPAVVALAQPSSKYIVRFFEEEASFLEWVEGDGLCADSAFSKCLAVEVQVTVSHVMEALDAAVAHGDSKAKIFRWLMPISFVQDAYGMSSEDFDEVIRRAEEIKWDERSRGIEDGIGVYALALLEKLEKQVRGWVNPKGGHSTAALTSHDAT